MFTGKAAKVAAETSCKIASGTIGGFRGVVEGAAPLFSCSFKLTQRFCFENRFIKCCLILSSETLTLLYFASQIRPQCRMTHILKSEVFIQGGGGGGNRAPLSKFSGSAPGCSLVTIKVKETLTCDQSPFSFHLNIPHQEVQ